MRLFRRRSPQAERRCASPTSAPAPARFCWRCCPSFPSNRRRHRHQRGCAGDRRDECQQLGLAPRATFVAMRLCGGLVRAVRPDRLESALHPLGGHRGARSPRCATMIRVARWTAAAMGSWPIARSCRRRRACSRPAALRSRGRAWIKATSPRNDARGGIHRHPAAPRADLAGFIARRHGAEKPAF